MQRTKYRVQILLEPEQRELQALGGLTRLRLKIQEEHGINTGDLIEETRAERDKDMARVWRGEA